jgi:hypothetical protein
VIEIILTIISSAVKFAMTFPLAVLQFKFTFPETILWTNLGGLAGIYFFAFLSSKLIAWWNRVFGVKKNRRSGSERDKKIFTKKNRRIVRIKQKYGLPGIALTTPLLLSIPVGTFLVVRYYRTHPARFIYLIVSNLIWSVIYTAFYTFWNGLLFTKG